MKKALTILYIDDDLSCLLSVKEELIQHGITVLTENNGKCGIDTYEESSDEIDLVIVDVHMPTINGYDILITIRNNDNKIPIIVVTSNKFVENKDKILKLGANEYLSKPLDKKELLKIIKKLTK